MTAPDRPVQDLIADVVAEHMPDPWGGCCCGEDWDSVTWSSAHVAAAVVAACREAIVQQQAELMNGEVERGLTAAGRRIVSRAVGPWREDPS